ncbi:MAG TPA: DUF167 domain-containing protein [Longimicrobiales bacterium]
MKIEESAGGVRFRVRVQPRASNTEIAGAHGDAIRIRIAAPPVDGAANEELIRFLAKKLGVPRAGVTIVSGDSGRDKLIEISNARVADVRDALGGR